MSKIRVLEVGGTPYEMGYAHGEAYSQEIRELTEERMHLSSDPNWTGGHSLPREKVLQLGDACLAAHRSYAPQLVEELEGMADATGLTITELLIMNGFTDFTDVLYNASTYLEGVPAPHSADNCTAFIVPDAMAEGRQGFLGQTWDMHATATPYVILLRGRPVNMPAFLTFTITGCVGMIGMNEAGIAIGINNLLGGDGRPGVMWPFVVRKALAQRTLDDALECILSAPLAGAHNYLLRDAGGKGYNVEAMSTRYQVEEVVNVPYVHTNHCVIAENLLLGRPRHAASQESSEQRLSRADELLSTGPVTLETLMDLTCDDTVCVRSNAPFFVESCGAAIMRPATREFWAVWGLPAENEYERFQV